jgi:hypothetical protein
MRKAQAEFIVILGVVFLFVVVLFYAYQSGLLGRPSIPEDVAKVQNDVRESVESVIAGGSKLLLLDMETHGGYLTDPVFIGDEETYIPDRVAFVGEGTPYWQKCQNNLSLSREDIERMFEVALRNYILRHTDEFLDLFGKNVTFDLSRLDVDANILRDKIDVTVILPTTVQGYDIREPYTREIKTKFGEIIDFAADTAKEFSVNRNLDYFTIYSIYFSKNLGDGHPKLPTMGFMTKCGETVVRTTSQMEEYLLESANYVIANTFWWQNLSSDPTVSKTFGITDVDGELYMDLNVKTYLPDGFDVVVTGPPLVVKNPDPLVSIMMFQVPQCASVYNHVYEFSYPVVISVDDPLTGNSFNFASLVYIDEHIGRGGSGQNDKRMMPGECDANVNATDVVEPIENQCQDLSCSAKIRVVWYKFSDESEPLEGSIVLIGNCFAGITNSDGYVEGPVECGAQELSIYHNSSFGFYGETVSPLGMVGTYYLYYIPEMNVHYKRVSVSGYDSTPCTSSDQNYICTVGNFGDNELVSGSLVSGSNTYGLFSSSESSDESVDCMDSPECQACVDIDPDTISSFGNAGVCNACSDLCNVGRSFGHDVFIDYIPSGDYSFDVTVRDIFSGYEKGKIDLNYRLREDTEDLYLYVPDMWESVYEIEDYDGECMENVVANKCGIDLITTEVQPSIVYYYDCDALSLNEVTQDLQSRGCTANFADLMGDVEAVKSAMESECGSRLVCR